MRRTRAGDGAGARLAPRPPAEVRRGFLDLLDRGYRLAVAGAARADPSRLLVPRYLPCCETELFGVRFFLGGYRFDEALVFLIGYVLRARERRIHPRIFYKDSSLIWRVASHFVHDEREYWIGKGAVRVRRAGGLEHVESAEETVNLPYELQPALDAASRLAPRRRDARAVQLLVREAPSGRIEAYRDFTAPRAAAAARGRLNGGRPIARFERAGDPTSLVFVRGFEPDFARGVVERWRSSSSYFGGALEKARVLSTNRRAQYLFLASPTHAWVGPPQTLTTELSTYGVRVDDALAPEELSIPAFEYHLCDEGDGAVEHSQIPEGFAGAPHPEDPTRVDASAWIEALPVIREFRARVLAS